MTDWCAIAAAFGRTLRDLPLDEAVISRIARLPGDQPLVIACSGGADSIYLSLSLHALTQGGVETGHLSRLGTPLVLAHFHHGIRGTEADADADFVREFGEALGLGVRMGRAETDADSSEAALREARYAWLGVVCREEGAQAFCLGHHADDVLETQLMALCTGAGPAGLASPLPVKRHADGLTRLRPLLRVSREAIEATLRAVAAPWRTDSTNTSPAYTRNRIRSEVVPRLKSCMPQEVRRGSERTRFLMEEVTRALDRFLDEAGFQAGDSRGLDMRPLRGKPTALIRRGLMAWWLRHFSALRLEKSIADVVVTAVAVGEKQLRISLGRDHELVLMDGIVRLHPRRKGPVWSGSVQWACLAGPLYLPGGAVMKAERIANPQVESYSQADPCRAAWMDTGLRQVEVRTWRTGDRYQPLGAPGRRKLQDLLTDRKVKTEQKRSLPVVVDDEGEILWVPGLPPAHRLRLHPGSKSALKLTYHPEPSPLPFLQHGRNE